jgi:hypothetical protein
MGGQNCNAGAMRGKTYNRAHHSCGQKSVKREGFRPKLLLWSQIRRENNHGFDRAEVTGTMKRFQTEVVVEPLLRESYLCSRSVAAVAPHLNYWTDFGRLTTTLP